MRILTLCFLFLVKVSLGQKPDEIIKEVSLPDGFEIEVFASDIENARSLASSDNGVVFVGNRKGGKVYALEDSNGDGKADKTHILQQDLNFDSFDFLLELAML